MSAPGFPEIINVWNLLVSSVELYSDYFCKDKVL